MITPTTIHNGTGKTPLMQLLDIRVGNPEKMLVKSCGHRLSNGWCSKSQRPCPIGNFQKQQQP
jgi:hypothetical protein